VERDILWVTITCLLIVASRCGYFRRLRACPGGRLAVIGTVMAFAMAELFFGYVNSSTAFLDQSSWATASTTESSSFRATRSCAREDDR